MLSISPDSLTEFIRCVATVVGMNESSKEALCRGLVNANIRGVDSHGVLRIPQYVASIQAGQVNAVPEVALVRESGATALVDADGGYGFEPTFYAANLACDVAERFGIGVVGVRRSHHFGMAANYALSIAERGKIGLLFTTSSPVLPPPGGSEAILGNSPICFGFPARGRPSIILDMAVSEAAFGKIRLAAAEEREIPSTWAFDAEGKPTVDPNAALAAGLLAPIGGYKGYGLAFVSAVLAGVLTGSPFGRDASGHRSRSGGVGHLVVSMDPESFVGDAYYDSLECLVNQVKQAKVGPGHTAPLLPGEPEWRTSILRIRDGIPLSIGVVRQLNTMSEQLGVDLIESFI